MHTTELPRQLSALTTTHPPDTTQQLLQLRELSLLQKLSVRFAIWLLARTPRPITHAERAHQLARHAERERRELNSGHEYQLRCLRA